MKESVKERDREKRGEEKESPRLARLLPFVAVLALFLGMSWLVIGFWLRDIVWGGWGAVGLAFVLTLVPLFPLLRGFGGSYYPKAWVRLLLFRPFFYGLLLLPLLAVGSLLGGLIGWALGAAVSGGRWGLVSAAAVLLVGVVWGYIDSKRLQVRRLEARMPRLPMAFDGMKVVQVSDLHVGPHTPRRFLERVRRTIEKEKADLVVSTGDQVDDFAFDTGRFNAFFGRLKAPLGVYAVIGNHDVYADWKRVREGLEFGGYRVLVNEAQALEREGERLWISGTGDPAAGQMGDRNSLAAPNAQTALWDVPEDEAVLVLAHNPALWPQVEARGADLTLSGHTHYGQFAFPKRGWSLASVFLDLAMGAHRKGRSLLYINPGTNYWGIPFRLGTPPEVTVLTLRRGEGEAAILDRGKAPA